MTPDLQTHLTEAEQAALVLVHDCFGGASMELLQFVRFLTQRHGLPWLDDSANPINGTA